MIKTDGDLFSTFIHLGEAETREEQSSGLVSNINSNLSAGKIYNAHIAHSISVEGRK